MSNFIHLTNKTEYSLSEGALPIGRIAELCQSFQMPAVGISDTNNMFGALEFSERISQVGVQPIVGCNIKIKTPKEYLHENIPIIPNCINPTTSNIISKRKTSKFHSCRGQLKIIFS